MSNRARSLACALLIVLVGVLTYANSLSGPLIGDDPKNHRRGIFLFSKCTIKYGVGTGGNLIST